MTPFARAHAGKVERLLDVLQVPLPAPHARHLLRAVRQGIPHARLVQPGHGRRGGDGAKRGADGFGAAMGGADMHGAERPEPAAAEIVAERHAADQVGSRPVVALADGQGRGHDRCAWMGLRHRIGIVSFVGMGGHRIRQHRVHGRCPDVGGKHGRFGYAALGPDVANRHLSGLEAGARDNRGEGIENAMFRGLHDRRGQRAVARLHHVAGHPRRDVSGRDRTVHRALNTNAAVRTGNALAAISPPAPCSMRRRPGFGGRVFLVIVRGLSLTRAHSGPAISRAQVECHADAVHILAVVRERRTRPEAEARIERTRRGKTIHRPCFETHAPV